MSTKYEADLQDIEAKLRNPRKGQEVSEAEKLHLKAQRGLEKLRTELTAKYSGPIKCQWMEAPVKWESATAIVQIGDETNTFTVEPYENIGDGKERLKPRLVRNGYESEVEKWAIWKWNSMRGAEIVTDGDEYIQEVSPPAFEWDKPAETPVVRARGRPKSVNAAHG